MDSILKKYEVNSEKRARKIDGGTRNYQKLKEAKKIYDQQQIKTLWFLHKKYQSNARNLTSNEAEACAVNGGIIYYLDTGGQKIDFRKAYQTPYGERKYYTESISLEDIALDSQGEFNTGFLENYKKYVLEQKRALDRVLRVPIEDGVE